MGITNKDFYGVVMEEYKKTANRLMRASNNATKEMEKVEKIQLEILKDSKDFSDVIEKIQNRPKFGETQIGQFKLPELDTKELSIQSKNAEKLFEKYKAPELGIDGLLVTPEIKSNGIINHDLPFLENSIFGSEVSLALNKIAGTEIVQAIGSKKSDQIFELSKEVDSIAQKVDEIVPKLERIKRSANKFYNTIVSVRETYLNEFSIVISAVDNFPDYNEFLNSEKVALKNTVLLIGLLYQMCKVKLLKSSDMDIECVELNEEIDKEISKSNTVLKQVKLANIGTDSELYQATEQVDETSESSILSEDTINYLEVSMECADAVGTACRYVDTYTALVYFDENNNKLYIVDKESGEKNVLDMGIDFSSSTIYDFCGIGDFLYFVVKDCESGYNELYQYSVSKNEIDTIYKSKSNTNDKERFYAQCNDQYVVFQQQSGMYQSDGLEIVVFDYIDGSEECILKEDHCWFVLDDTRICYYSTDGNIFIYSISDKNKTKLCEVGYSFAGNRIGHEECALIENNKLICWTMNEGSCINEGIEILSIDLETHDKNKWKITDTCNLMGKYHDGYVYYIRCDSRDSLCRYSLSTKKTEKIVSQTDCSWSAVSGFLKKITTYYVDREDVCMNIIGDFLYYNVGRRFTNTGCVMRVELENDFLLCEV